MPGQNSDVIVVGGGPAGSGAAIWLARAGFSVTLLDRARFPRDKACGEYLTPKACCLLEDLGIWQELIARGARPVRSTLLVAPDGSATHHRSQESALTGYTLRRVILDESLIRAARASGVDVQEGVTVRGVLRDASGHTTGVSGKNEHGEPTRWNAPLILGADGTHSLIARELGMVRSLPRLQRVAVVTHWRNVVGSGDTIEMRTRGGVVCGLGFPGEVDGMLCANVTLVVPTERASQIAGRAGEFVEEIISEQFPDLAEQLRGAEREESLRTVGCFGHRCKPAAGAGVMLVGDAATFIDPFTGEGVYFALRGAQLAAETGAQALHAKDVSIASLMRYQKVRNELAQRYRLCEVVQAVVRHPRLFPVVVQQLDRRSFVRERLLDVLGDIRPPTDMIHPGFLWQLFAPSLS